MKTIILSVIIISFTVITNAQQVRTAYIKGKVYTVNNSQPFAETIITEKGRIIFAGAHSDAEAYITPDTRIVHLNGRFTMPGFTDSHLHFIDGGLYMMGVNLRPARSKEEFVSMLKEYVEKHPDRWIKGGRWDHESWEVKELPDKHLIDPFTPETPVFVSRIDGHIGVANSLALKLAGITKDTKDPEGGMILRDKNGEPTGILKDNAMKLVFNIIPTPGDDELGEALEEALKQAARYGITAVHDMVEPEYVSVYKKFGDRDKLTCRVYGIYPIDNFRELKELIKQGKHKGNNFSIGGIKAYSDGSLGAMTAWFHEPYFQNPASFGLPNDIVTDGRLREWAFDIDEHNIQLCTHAIGDKANSFMLDLYTEVKEKNPDRDRRFRIEHAQHLRPEDFPRFAEADVIASLQPYHAIDDGVWAEKRIGAERIKYTHAYKTLSENEVVVAFGTDWPVAPLNPMLGLYAAVTRRTVDDKNPDGWIPEQKLTVEEAIRNYTLNGAYAGFMENNSGSIEEGKFADFIVLDHDLLKIDPVNIKDVKVIMTIFNGEVIYEQ